jgi:hypothetical protein
MNEKAVFFKQRLSRYHDDIELVPGNKLFKLMGVGGVMIYVLDPDEMDQNLLDEVVDRINMTYQEGSSIVCMATSNYMEEQTL